MEFPLVLSQALSKRWVLCYFYFSLIKIYSENYQFSPFVDWTNFNFFDEEKMLEDLEIKNEIININPLLFRLKFNNIKNDLNVDNKNSNDKNIFLEDKLKALKKIAFQNGEEENNESSSKERFDTFYDDYKKDENIMIDGKYYKKMDTDEIAKKVLKKCNWNHKKVNYKNMEGRSKLMFTNGLTIKEFEMKYGILP